MELCPPMFEPTLLRASGHPPKPSVALGAVMASKKLRFLRYFEAFCKVFVRGVLGSIYKALLEKLLHSCGM